MDNKTIEEETTIKNGITHDHKDLKANSTDDATGKSTVVEALNTSSSDSNVDSESVEPITKKLNGDSVNKEATTVVTNLNQSTDEDCFIVSSDDEADSDFDDNDVMITGISDTSGELQWRNLSDPVKLFYSLMMKYGDPASILLNVFHVSPSRIPPSAETQKALLFHILSEPQPRRKLPEYNCLDDVLNLLHTCTKILVITGAGISVSCGIPDFRSRNGIYARLAVDYPDLTTPQSMFELTYFKTNQRPFFKFAREIYPGQYKPSISHRFIKCLESRDKLLRNYTQNIDTLEQEAGISRVINCHGSFATASCMTCKCQVSGSEVKEDILSQKIPRCTVCPAETELAVMKPDIVFFGEELPEKFHSTFAEDKENADFVIVIGSSLKVRPVAYMPASVPSTIPQILINREPLSSHEFDVELLGDCDVIIEELCQRLGWADVFEQESIKPGASNSQTDNKQEKITTTSDSTKPEENAEATNNAASAEVVEEKVDDESKSVADDAQPASENSESISKAEKGEEKQCAVSEGSTGGESVDKNKPSSSTSTTTARVKILNPQLIASHNSTDMEPCTSSSLNKIIFNPGKLTEIDGELLLMEDDPGTSEPDASNDERSQPRNLSDKLPDGSFACFKPNTYIFRGAEYFHLPDESDINSVETLSSDSDDIDEEGCLVQGHRASHPLCVSDDEEDESIVECKLSPKKDGSYLHEEMECIIDSDGDSEDVSASVCWKQRTMANTKRPRKSTAVNNSASEDVLEIESGTEDEESQPPKKIKITNDEIVELPTEDDDDDDKEHEKRSEELLLDEKNNVSDNSDTTVSKILNNNDSESTAIVSKSISNEDIQPARPITSEETVNADDKELKGNDTDNPPTTISDPET